MKYKMAASYFYGQVLLYDIKNSNSLLFWKRNKYTIKCTITLTFKIIKELKGEHNYLYEI